MAKRRYQKIHNQEYALGSYLEAMLDDSIEYSEIDQESDVAEELLSNTKKTVPLHESVIEDSKEKTPEFRLKDLVANTSTKDNIDNLENSNNVIVAENNERLELLQKVYEAPNYVEEDDVSSWNGEIDDIRSSLQMEGSNPIQVNRKSSDEANTDKIFSISSIHNLTCRNLQLLIDYKIYVESIETLYTTNIRHKNTNENQQTSLIGMLQTNKNTIRIVNLNNQEELENISITNKKQELSSIFLWMHDV